MGLESKIRDEAEARRPARMHKPPVIMASIPANATTGPVARGERHNDRGDDRGQRGVRAEDEDAARPEEGVRGQWDDGGIKAVIAGRPAASA